MKGSCRRSLGVEELAQESRFSVQKVDFIERKSVKSEGSESKAQFGHI